MTKVFKDPVLKLNKKLKAFDQGT